MMYTPCKLCRKDAVGRAPLSSVGLGEEIDIKAIDKEYRGMTKTGETVVPLLSQAGTMIGQATGTGLITGLVPKGVVKSIGININPLSMGLAPFTFGASLLPGVSSLLGKAFGVFSGLFKKATHMGDCMKWWTDANILNMGSVEPYSFDFHDYMMKNFPQFLRQYQVMQAGGQWVNVGVDRVLNVSNRRANVAQKFLNLVRSNPDMMMLQCAVQHRSETGFTQYTQEQVDTLWGQIREAARREEYVMVAPEVDRLVAPFKVKEIWGAIVKSREAGLLIKNEHGAQLAVPPDVIGVRRGTYTQVLKSGQTSLKPVIFK